MTNPQITHEEIANALRAFLSWFEDNFSSESWFDPDDETDSPNGTWKSYLDLPEYMAAAGILKKINV